jgi:hypothetical protein
VVEPFEERPPCVVCGAEGGNCGPEGDKPHHVQFKEWGPQPRKPKEPDMANAVVATERIHEVLTIPKTERTRRVLRYAPGQVVSPEDVDRLNVKADGTQGKIPTTDPTDGVVPLAAKKAAAKKAPARKAAAKKATTKKAAPRKKAAAKKVAPRR